MSGFFRALEECLHTCASTVSIHRFYPSYEDMRVAPSDVGFRASRILSASHGGCALHAAPRSAPRELVDSLLRVLLAIGGRVRNNLGFGFRACVALAYAAGCNGSSTRVPTGGGSPDAAVPTECANATTHSDKVVCAANAFLAMLSDSEKATATVAFTDAIAKTRWSNLPGTTRSGIQFSALGADKLAAAKGVAKVALTAAGYTDFAGILAADDYLGTQSGNSTYSSGNYSIAMIGTPSSTGKWMLQLGGHHMAFNLTYLSGVGYPTPNHAGVEPKVSFTVNGITYEPLTEEGAALAATFKALDPTQLNAAYLTGAFPDVVVGPVEYGKGTYATASFPTGANRKGVVASTLSASQQALLQTAIEQWVRDYDPAVADPLIAAYTSAAAYADTYIAWGGTQASGVDVDVSGTYMRIDGPRLWLEVACQEGVVLKGKTHYHTIFRDKEWDYGKSL